METNIHLSLRQEDLVCFFDTLHANQKDIGGNVFNTTWFQNAALAAYNNFTIDDFEVDDFPALDAALALVPEEEFTAYLKDKDQAKSIKYCHYMVFITTLRRLVINTVMTKADKEDFRFEHTVSPPLDAYKYQGADKVTDIYISAEAYDFLTR